MMKKLRREQKKIGKILKKTNNPEVLSLINETSEKVDDNINKLQIIEGDIATEVGSYLHKISKHFDKLKQD